MMSAVKPSFSTMTIDLEKKKNMNNSAYSTYMFSNYEGIMEPVTEVMNCLKTQKNSIHPNHFDTHSQNLMSIILKIIESKESKDAILDQLAKLEKAINLHKSGVL